MDARTLCLGVLSLGEASGYEIRKIVEEGPFSQFHETSFGSIYPALKDLGAQGLVTYEVQTQDGRPDKKVYRITGEGRAALAKALLTPPVKDKVRSDAIFMLFFGNLVSAGRRLEVFEFYRENIRRQMEDLDCSCGDGEPAARRFVNGLGKEVYGTILRYMEENRHLLEEDPAP